MALTYGSYLALDELLALQRQQSEPPEHDELLFIVIHQVYELWFKQTLHELDWFAVQVRDSPALGMHQLKRVLKIVKTLVAQLDVLETMTPLDFGSFRSFLESSSGFQSVQFRELEFLLGIKDPSHLTHDHITDAAAAQLLARYDAPTIWDGVLARLAGDGFGVPADVLTRDVRKRITPDARVQEVLVAVYRDQPALMELCEALTDMDEGLMEWRYRHMMMVRRTIGSKAGTGGSDGAAYLQSTLFQPAFPDLWAIRTSF